MNCGMFMVMINQKNERGVIVDSAIVKLCSIQKYHFVQTQIEIAKQNKSLQHD